ncbi:Receptor expression-enhancing protein isoform 2 [Schistosoma japonicum]|uniref:Receptor expression-enhancing protein n=1 Tax=Schistosoma japonicum TaxID=6182 RepID=Q5DE02_SCHJA|nr:unknown [Schistosoma japonicum]KAH8856870.1 Receptor expression-enhancing protein 6 [Schistosoma japonicum]TNN05751.1 Receptor expression-enhancing protein isoform 2 [Schistosoma japonicum]
MEKLKCYQSRFAESLEKKNVVTDFLSLCETRSGISKLYLAYGIAFLTLYLVIGYGTDILTLLVGALYPAYQSVKAIETHEKEDDTKWLTYWVVFASVQLFEACTAMMIYYLPLYPIIKCVFLIYCMIPIQQNGSLLIYRRLIRPFVLEHSAEIDSVINSTAVVAGNMMESGMFSSV